MVVLRAIGGFFARIGRWIRDTAWVQPLLIVGGIFAIIFSIPSITSWVQSWFATGDAAISFYYNTGYLSLTNGEQDGTNSDAEKLLKYIFKENELTEEELNRDKNWFGDKFFVLFVQEDCSTCKSIYTGWETALNNWGNVTGFKQVTYSDGSTVYNANHSDLKIFTIFVDEENDKEENIFWKLHDNQYTVEFSNLSSLTNPYATKNSVSYTNLSNSGSTDISGDAVFTTPTAMLFDRKFSQNEDKFTDKNGNEITRGATDPAGYSCDNNGIEAYNIPEILFDVPTKGNSESGLGRARSIWDCWNHIDQFDNYDTDVYHSI